MQAAVSEEFDRAADIRGFIRLSGPAYVAPICLLFMVFDYLWYPQHFASFAIIRLVQTIGMVLIIRYAKSDRLAVMQRWFAAYVGFIALEIHAVIYIIGDASTPYYTTLAMVTVGLAGELGTNWRWYAFNVAQIILPYAAYGVLAARSDQLKIFGLNLFFLICITSISTVGRLFARGLRNRERQLRRRLQNEVETRDGIIAAKTQEAMEMQARRTRLNEEIARANERMTITEQVAHDIRSPLSALTVTVAHASGLSAEYRDLVRDAVERIAGIANDLLSRARADRRTIADRGRRDLGSLIDQIVAEKRLRLREDLAIDVELNDAICAAVDGVEFQRALSNLIDNAIEASAANARVRLILSAGVGDFIEVRVIDQGRGIPAEVLARLGQRGVSFGKPGGNGLGIHHAYGFARAAGGNLSVHSEPGRGTTVILNLPGAGVRT